MASRIGTTEKFKSALAGVLATVLFHAGTSCAFAQSIEFSASIPLYKQGGASLWPRTIVTFTDRALLPVAAICNADCDGLAIRHEGKARRHQLLLIEGQGPMAIVPVKGERLVLTACVHGSCMDYQVVVAR